MTHIEFVRQRLRDMEATPLMWGSTRESFGLQLLLLAEVAQLTVPDMYKAAPYELNEKLFRKSPMAEALTEEWAKEAVAKIYFALRRRLDPDIP